MNRNLLMGKIVSRGKSVPEVSEALDISKVTFYRKLKKGSFTIGEADRMCSFLGISNPREAIDIFLPMMSQKWDKEGG